MVAANEATARWACQAVDLGGPNKFAPLVLGPSGIPEVVDAEEALADPELAVLSAMAYGKDADTQKSARIALAAQLASRGLDEDRSKLYVDLVFNALSEAARRAFQAMSSAKYDYQSGLGSGFFEHGREEGRQEGARTMVIKQLTLRFGSLTEAARTQLADASIEELDAIGERLLSAPTLEKALGSH